jgi:hypothetical protein
MELQLTMSLLCLWAGPELKSGAKAVSDRANQQTPDVKSKATFLEDMSIRGVIVKFEQ